MDFLVVFLKEFGFSVNGVTGFKSCLTSSKPVLYFVKDVLTNEFQFYKGLKQGDPLSPFLLYLGMESLIALLQRSFYAVDDYFLRGVGVTCSGHPSGCKVRMSRFKCPFPYYSLGGLEWERAMTRVQAMTRGSIPVFHMSIFKVPSKIYALESSKDVTVSSKIGERVLVAPSVEFLDGAVDMELESGEDGWGLVRVIFNKAKIAAVGTSSDVLSWWNWITQLELICRMEVLACFNSYGFQTQKDVRRSLVFHLVKTLKFRPIRASTKLILCKLSKANVDLTGVSPLVGLRDNEFVAGQAALKAESSKVAKHEKACLENQHVFIPFAFDTFGFLAPEAEEFLNRVPK
ncbi:hypothetical protein Tco_0199693 [Tanacetum coccineum]